MNKEIVENIKNSKKYKAVYRKTIERIAADCVVRFGEKTLRPAQGKRAEKEAKNLLHQVWGAFYKTRPNFEKVLESFRAKVESDKNIRQAVLPILNLQSSIKERIPILDEFYKKIFEITGIPNSIIDYACGLNPLTLQWMNLHEKTTYKAYDIDEEEVEFLKSMGIDARLGDILIDSFEAADVIFLFKLLPCLEHQKKGSSLEILKKLKFKYAVVSFPIKSISGKEKGMTDFYSNNFKNLLEKEGFKWTEILFKTELVFVIRK